MRVGLGYDVHKLVEDRKLIIGGVEIPYEKGLLGHSDADVLLHAIMDALLGAAALGDIGKHFPDTDDAYKGISSIKLLEKVGELLDKNNYIIENIDATIIAQKPKMRPYIDTMRENIAKALKIDVNCVNVKATTEEGLGFTGISSSTTTYIIAPAAKLKKYGIAGVIIPAASIVTNAATGSTTPDRNPYRNDFPLPSPLALSGIDIIAPSGKF
jgi:2-C-methyl-D-erythritol 2,4-cyclodiphosphate synthase